MKATKAYGAIRHDVPHRLRQVRQEKNLSLEELAERVGISWQTLQKYETEPQRLRVHQLQALADALDCTPADLISPPGEPESWSERALRERIGAMTEEEQERALSILEAAFGTANDRVA